MTPLDPDPRYVAGPEPVRLACPSCGRLVRRRGRCADCIERRADAVGWVVVAFVAFIACLVIAVLGWYTAPRSAPDAPTVPSPAGDLSRPAGDASVRPGPSGASPAAAVAPSATAESERVRPADGAPRYRGTATWCAPTPRHCHGWDRQYVGAVPSFTFGDDPYWVQVCLAERPATCTHVLVVSFCACRENGIDLAVPAFLELAPLSRGRVAVLVERTDAPAGPTLPPTDIQEEP